MAQTHVVSALRAKRAEISGHIHDLEKRIARQRANLAHVDASIRLFSPDTDPDAIPPKRLYRRTRYFAKGELQRHCLDMLRAARGPIAAPEMAASIMAAKGLDTDANVTERVLSVLRKLLKRGAVTKSGTTQNVRWAMVRD